MTTAAEIADVERLCLSVAPEMGGRPLYVIPLSAVPGASQTNAAGWYGRMNDLVHKREIGERWRGRGVALVADDECGPGWFAATTLHELAHAVELAGEEDFTRQELPAGLTAAAATEIVVRNLKLRSPVEVQIAHHGAQWCRLLIHLLVRASPAVSDWRAWAWAFAYDWLAPVAHDLRAALRYEPGRHFGRPLAELLATDPPPAFVEVWERAADRALATEAKS